MVPCRAPHISVPWSTRDEGAIEPRPLANGAGLQYYPRGSAPVHVPIPRTCSRELSCRTLTVSSGRGVPTPVCRRAEAQVLRPGLFPEMDTRIERAPGSNGPGLLSRLARESSAAQPRVRLSRSVTTSISRRLHPSQLTGLTLI